MIVQHLLSDQSRHDCNMQSTLQSHRTKSLGRMRRRTCPIQLLPIVLLYLISIFITFGQGQEDGLVGKDRPEKGNTKCPSLADRFNYFTSQNSSSSDEAAADIWLTPCQETDASGDGGGYLGYDVPTTAAESGDLPDNALALNVYASLPAYASDLRNVFSWGVIGFLDEISLEYDVLSNFSTPVDLFNYTERRNNPTNIDAQIIFQYMVPTKIKENEASWWYHYRLVFFCYYGNAHVNRVGTPILNTDLDTMKKDNVTLKLRSVEQRLNYYLRQGVDIVNVFNIRSLSYNVLGFSMEDPIKSTTPFLDGPPTPPPTVSPSYYNNENDDVLFNDTSQWNNDGAPPDGTDDERDESGDGEGTMHPPSSSQNGPNNHSKVNDPYTNDQVTYPDFITYTSPVNVQSWDWRRYLGLFVFIGTFVGTIVLTQLASYRRRKIMEQTIWGNIGTEQGVEALLSTGWKFKDSTVMEVYNKAGMGYRDDDSMLLGGYEQTHTTPSIGNEGGNVSSSQQERSYEIGGEITITPDGSLSTPEYIPSSDDQS